MRKVAAFGVGVRRVWVGAVLMGLVAAAGCDVDSARPVPGSGTRTTETRIVEPFQRVSLSGSFIVELAHGPATEVILEVDDNLQKLVRTRVTADVLEIEPTAQIRPTQTVRVRLTHPSLRGVAIAGSASVDGEGLALDAFDLAMSGAGSARLTGTARAVSIRIAGSGRVDLSALTAEDVEITVSGAGSVRVTATRALKASISGSGSVVYGGSPKEVSTSISGSGSIKPLP